MSVYRQLETVYGWLLSTLMYQNITMDAPRILGYYGDGELRTVGVHARGSSATSVSLLLIKELVQPL